MSKWWLVAMLASIGCNTTPDNGVDGNEDDVDDPFQGSEMGPLEQCDGYTDAESGEFTPVPGATTYFAGDFLLNEEGTEVQGTEAWILFTNEKWTQENPEDGKDCKMVWKAAGLVDTENKCVGCEYRLHMVMHFDEDETDCAPDFVRAHKSEENFEIDYDVRMDCTETPCTTEFTFGASGNELGEGEAAGARITYVSDPACKFF